MLTGTLHPGASLRCLIQKLKAKDVEFKNTPEGGRARSYSEFIDFNDATI